MSRFSYLKKCKRPPENREKHFNVAGIEPRPTSKARRCEHCGFLGPKIVLTVVYFLPLICAIDYYFLQITTAAECIVGANISSCFQHKCFVVITLKHDNG